MKKVVSLILIAVLIFAAIPVPGAAASSALYKEFEVAYQLWQNFSNGKQDEMVYSDLELDSDVIMLLTGSLTDCVVELWSGYRWSNGSTTYNYSTDRAFSQVDYYGAWEKAKQTVKALITPDMDFQDKLTALHDYIVLNTAYDEKAASSQNGYEYAYEAAGVFSYGKAVCEGYSNAFKMLCRAADIPCFSVSSRVVNHTWNVVYDGRNYWYIDVTFDDPIPDRPGQTSYEYFLLTSAELRSMDNYHIFEDPKYVTYYGTPPRLGGIVPEALYMQFFDYVLSERGLKDSTAGIVKRDPYHSVAPWKPEDDLFYAAEDYMLDDLGPLNFKDVASTHWAYNELYYMAGRGILLGYPDGTFRPENPVTRAEFSAMLVRMLDAPTRNRTTNNFADVKEGDWFTPYVSVSENYLKFYREGNLVLFKPNEKAIRVDVAVALTKAMEMEAASSDISNINKFTDSAAFLDEDKKYVSIAIANDLIQGYPDGSFRPNATITRAEAAALLYRIMKKYPALGGTGRNGYGGLVSRDRKYKYTGQWKNDQFHGKGELTSVYGFSYKGDFVDGYFDGQGVMSLTGGLTYTGGFSQDMFSGYGELVVSTGESYKGDFKNANFDGYGVYKDKNGAVVYDGLWISGFPGKAFTPNSAQSAAFMSGNPSGGDGGSGGQPVTGFNKKEITEVFVFNNPDSVPLLGGNAGHQAMGFRDADGNGYYVSFGPEGSAKPFAPGEVKFEQLTPEAMNDFLRTGNYDNQHYREVSVNVNKGDGEKMFDTAQRIYDEKPNYNILGGQCDNKVSEIMKSGGVEYKTWFTPNMSYEVFSMQQYTPPTHINATQW